MYILRVLFHYKVPNERVTGMNTSKPEVNIKFSNEI